MFSYLNWKHTIWLLSCIETKLKWHWLSEIYFERFSYSLQIVLYFPKLMHETCDGMREKRNNCILLSSSTMQTTILRSILYLNGFIGTTQFNWFVSYSIYKSIYRLHSMKNWQQCYPNQVVPFPNMTHITI